MPNAWNKLLLLLCVLGMSMGAFAQSQDDLALIQQRDQHGEHEHYKPQYLFKGRSAVVKYNPVSLFFGGMMLGYQKLVSPQISSYCLYEESCSKFGVRLIKEYGLIKGAALAIDRVSRCNRLSASDIPAHMVDPHSHKAKDHLSHYRLSPTKQQ